MAPGLGRALLRRLERQRAEGASDLVFRGSTGLKDLLGLVEHLELDTRIRSKAPAEPAT